MTDWRTGGRLLRGVGVAGLAGFLSVVPPFRLSAQVGHDPAHSPYRDIRRGAGPVVFAGRLTGDRGRVGVGPGDALSIGLRYERSLSRAMVLQFSTALLKGDRFIVNPAADSASPNRRTGPVDADVLLTEMGLQLRLTGAKTWHGLAPYLGAGIGLAFDARSPGDTTRSGYRFGTKATMAGIAGVRWHPARRVTVHADAHALFWRLRYPVSFHTPAGDGTRVLPLSQRLTDWTLHPWISLGVGWTF
ncbi:MAG: hypothetical protein ACREMC_01450 [Gemmatimonadales bacterium]